MTTLDAHLHLWDPAVLEYGWLDGRLRRRHGPDELAVAERGADAVAPVVERIFVQADCRADQAGAEVRWAASIAEEARIVGIVAYAPLELGAEAVAPALAAYAANPLVVGVRRLLQSEPIGFSASPSFRAAARALAEHGLVFDACVVAEQLGDVVELADAVPELAIVLDHLGKPVVGSRPEPGWIGRIEELARHPSVTVKLSGLPAEVGGEWSPAQVEPYLDVCLTAFGPDRLLYGSDWPVSQPMSRWRETVASWAHDRLGPESAAAVLGGNARRVYGVRSSGAPAAG